MSEWKS